MSRNNPTRGAKRRELSRVLSRFSEDDAEHYFAAIRFGSDTRQACPHCGTLANHYRLPRRRQWRCRSVECGHTFSVVSGTRFDASHLTNKQRLDLLVRFEAAPKGRTLADLSGLVGMTEKSAHQNQMKLREAIMENLEQKPLEGVIHMDGAWVCGKFRRSARWERLVKASHVLAKYGTTEAKRKLPRINKTSKANLRRAKNKRVMLAMVQVDRVNGGSERVIVAMCRSENSRDVLALARQYIKPGATIMTDEHPSYGDLGGEYLHAVVNHSREYSTAEGVNENMAETFFSRVRRSEYGVHHGYRPRYMQLYAAELAWRETRRRRLQVENVAELARWMLGPGYSKRWRGYHGGVKRRHRRDPRMEILMGSPEEPWQDARSKGCSSHDHVPERACPPKP